MAIFTFHNPSGSAYFTTEEASRDNRGFYTSASFKYGSGSFSNFTGSNPDHVVQSDYIWAQVIPPGTSSFEFIPHIEIPVSGVYFRGTGEFNVTIET